MKALCSLDMVGTQQLGSDFEGSLVFPLRFSVAVQDITT